MPPREGIKYLDSGSAVRALVETGLHIYSGAWDRVLDPKADFVTKSSGRVIVDRELIVQQPILRKDGACREIADLSGK